MLRDELQCWFLAESRVPGSSFSRELRLNCRYCIHSSYVSLLSAYASVLLHVFCILLNISIITASNLSLLSVTWVFKAICPDTLPLNNSIEGLSSSDQLLCSSLSRQSVSSYNSHDDCSRKVVPAKLDRTHLTLSYGKLDIQHVHNDLKCWMFNVFLGRHTVCFANICCTVIDLRQASSEIWFDSRCTSSKIPYSDLSETQEPLLC